MQFRYLLALSGEALLASCSVLNLEARAVNRNPCKNPAVFVVDQLLAQVPGPASSVCSTLLHRTAYTTTTTVTRTTSSVVPTTKIQTLVSGTSIVTIATQTTATTSSVVTTVTRTTIPYGVTDIIVNKRGTPTKLGDIGPGLPTPLLTVALDLASSACSCFLGPATPVATQTATVSVVQIATSTATATVTTPATTRTDTIVSTSTETDLATQTIDVCGATVTGTSQCACTYQIFCDMYAEPNVDGNRVFTGTSNAQECVDVCDGEPGCTLGDWSIQNGDCLVGDGTAAPGPQQYSYYFKRIYCPVGSTCS